MIIENEKILGEEIPEGPKAIISSILVSNELSILLSSKLEKYTTNLKAFPGNKYKGNPSKLEEGYESSDSGDSTTTINSTISSSTYSSTFSDASSINSDIQSMSKDNNIQTDEFFKIRKEINELRTIIPNDKSNNNNNLANVSNSEIKDNNKNNDNNKIISSYPLEFYEIFPNLKKYEINQSSSQDSIEKPIYFIKNLILKNYHESLLYTQNKFFLQNFKNSPQYQYKIMNMSMPNTYSFKKEKESDITCMVIGYYQNYNTDTKNKEIAKFSSVLKNLISANQNLSINFIFFGHIDGLILQYVLFDVKADIESGNNIPADSFFEYREYSINNIIKEEKIDKHVLSMSLSDNEKYLLAGYASGHIIIWRTTNGKILNIFDDIFDMPVVSCELISVSHNEKEVLFLAGDLIGKVRLIHYTKKTFSENRNIIVVSNCFYPSLLLKKLKLNGIVGKEDSDINKINDNIKNNKEYICIIGSLEYLELFTINKENLKITSKLIVKNPDLNILIPMTEEIKKNSKEFYSQKYLRDNLSKIEFPDAAFGLGYLGDILKLENNNNEPYILFTISWKNQILLYYFSKNLLKIEKLGWYINNSLIIKVGFIGTSLIYFVDKNNNIKIINVKLFNIYTKKNQNDSDSESENETNDDFDINYDYKRIKNKFLIPSSDIITIENPIKSISKMFTETINYYNPFIINTKYNIYLIQENNSQNSINGVMDSNMRHIHLLSYQEFFNEIVMKTNNWELFFCKFIDILKGNANTFGFIPENKEIKENLLIEKSPNKFVKNNYFGYYLNINYENKEEEEDEFQGDLGLNNPVEYNFLSIGIEFSIEIGSLDFIYNEIKKLKKQEKFKKYLVFQLEPFILNNKFQSNPDLISEELITEIINYYILNDKDDEENPFIQESKEKLFKLDLILCHLNIEIIKKIKKIEDIIKKNKLFCSSLYFYSNGLNNFIKPLEYLFDEFNKSNYTTIPKELLNTYFKKAKQSRGFYRDNYSDLIRSLKTGHFDLQKNLFISKDFIGHLILSFIQLTLKGFLFPNIGKIPKDSYNKIIPELFLFLTKKNVAMELISFDSFSYFETLTLFILREDEINKIYNEDISNSNILNNFEQNKNKNNFCPLNINQMDIEKLKSNINEYIDNNDKNNNNIILDDNLLINQIYFYELIYKIIDLCENQKISFGNLIIKFDLYLFLIKSSLKIEGISLKMLNKAFSSIFNFQNEIKNIKKSIDSNSFAQYLEKIDKFRCHYAIIRSIFRRKHSATDELSNIIILVIKKYYLKKDDNNANNEVINNLLKMSATSNFLGVKIFLYELKKEYIFCIRVFLSENRKISKRVFTFIEKTLNYFKENKDEKNLQNFKNEIKKIISNLAGVSSSETFKIIHHWFNSIDIISNLNNLPKLQFKYLDKIKSIYKRKLKNEKSLETEGETLKKEYSEILLLYIKLLFYFEKESRVIKILRAESDYINIKECLKICLPASIEASVFLYKLIGDERSALKICLDKIKKDYEDIKINAKNNSQGDLINNKFEEIKKLIDESIDICENYSENSEVYKRRNSIIINNKNINNRINNDNVYEKLDMGEEYWLELFDQIYRILNDSEKRNSLVFTKIKNYLSQKIENLLIIMSYYVDFGIILKNVSNELEFSLFKKFLNKIFYTKSHLSNLYNSYINLLSCKINKNLQSVEINEQEGENIRLTTKEKNENNSEKEKLILDRVNKYNFNYNYSRSKEINENTEKNINDKNNIIDKNPKIYKKCCLCLKMINFIDNDNNKFENENSELILFKCEHIYHINCLLNEYNEIQKNLKCAKKFKDNFCPKCVNIETDLFSFINNENDTKIKNENNIINNNIEIEHNLSVKEDISSIELRKKKIEEKKKRKNLKKLNLLDNNYFEQIDILQSTLDGI